MKQETLNLIGWNEMYLIPDGYLPIAFSLDDLTFKVVTGQDELVLEVIEWKEKTKWDGEKHLPDGYYNNWIERGIITGARGSIDSLLYSLSVSTVGNYSQYHEPKVEAMKELSSSISSLSLSFIERTIETRFPKLPEMEEM